MTKTLIDTSAWVAFFRPGGDAEARRVTQAVEELLDNDQAAICGMVELEILQGVRAHERAEIESLLSALHYLDTTRDDFRLAGKLLGDLRARGVTVPPSDGLIAAQAIARGLPLLERDRHFAEIEALQRLP